MRLTCRTALAVTAAVGLLPLGLSSCVFPSPNPSSNARLLGVASTSSTNAWAVGIYHDSTGDHDLAEHWDGQRWQVWPLPAPLGTGLYKVAAVSASNVWAVGYSRTLHFGGSSWYAVATPAGVHLHAVSAGPDGTVSGVATKNSTTLLMAMTAGGWRTVSTIPTPTTQPACEGAGGGFADLAVSSPSDIWAVGSTVGPTQNNSTPICMVAEHWNGRRWQITPTPALSGSQQNLAGVSAHAPGDVWAVGTHSFQYPSTGRWVDNSVVLHYTGGKWQSVASVDVKGGGQLQAVDATGTGVWAVGSAPQQGGQTSDMLIKKLVAGAMVDQPVQQLPVAGTLVNSGRLDSVSVRGNVVTSVGNHLPDTRTTATLTDRRNAS